MKKTTSHKQDGLCRNQTTGFMQEQHCTYSHSHCSARHHESASCTHTKHPAQPSGENMRRALRWEYTEFARKMKYIFEQSFQTNTAWQRTRFLFLPRPQSCSPTPAHKLTCCLRQHVNHTFLIIYHSMFSALHCFIFRIRSDTLSKPLNMLFCSSALGLLRFHNPVGFVQGRWT